MLALQPGRIVLQIPTQIRFIQAQNSKNNSSELPTPASRILKLFPIPIENRNDFFCVDPKSFTIEQLNKYKTEISQLIDIEKNYFEKINNDLSARINTYSHGILLAKEAIKVKSMNPQTTCRKIFLPDFKCSDDECIGCIDPKVLTITQLQLYIEGITLEIANVKNIVDEFKKEWTSHIDAYQNGIQRANNELSIRKRK